MPTSAFDELRFGPSKTLDLHGFPSADAAVRHAELWMRERQMARSGEVLVITGRGRRSADGVAVLRPAVEKLFTRLKRLGVVSAVTMHNEGSFAVTLAPVKALFDAPRRARAKHLPPRVDLAAFEGLTEGTRAALQHLAERALESLGAPTSPDLVRDEMLHQLTLLVPGLPPGEDPDGALRRIAQEVAETLEEQ